ncbi:MAG TPA: chemotaxis response regulator protein-glutamate methylesterase [Gammaproteobacteria bacterium]|nr:chemotaxis response regulator protein-glutamate methylesterase [Gammaproteobacteria bacterium]
MVARALVVDDSGFFRRRIVEILEADPRIKVVGTAADGRQAVEQAERLRPDVITMDIEMPVMDGIEAVRRIMSSRPTPVLMFSSLTHEGAQATLEALEAGAMDFLPKRFEDIARDREQATALLRRRILAVARRAPAAGAATPRPKPATSATGEARGHFRVVVIASSTGGPVALQQVLSRLPADFPCPVLVAQHMPASFTPAFAARLDQQCAVAVKEAADGDRLRAGQVYIAPGGRQMTLEQQGGDVLVRIGDGSPALHYKPCADITFNSVASVYGGQALALVLTGMGADGREGARILKQHGALVWSQDEDSCVIYGMPMAVAEAGLSDQVLSLRDIGPALAEAAGR